jgi:peptidoglycan/LPS O-acetylase OafA/YrhL
MRGVVRVSFVGAVVLALLGYGLLSYVRQSLDVTYDLGLVRCICGFFLGMTVCEYSRRSGSRTLAVLSSASLSRIEVALVIAVVLIMSFASGWLIVLVIPVFVVMVAILQSDRGLIADVLKSRVARFLGRISYSVYMVHFVLLIILSIFLKRMLGITSQFDPITQAPISQVNPWIGDFLVIGFISVVLGVSGITYILIEEPARLCGRRLASSIRSKEFVEIEDANEKVNSIFLTRKEGLPSVREAADRLRSETLAVQEPGSG